MDIMGRQCVQPLKCGGRRLCWWLCSQFD